MQGYLAKKNDKNKKWKPMYCVLQVDGSDTQLMYYENPKVLLLVLQQINCVLLTSLWQLFNPDIIFCP